MAAPTSIFVLSPIPTALLVWTLRGQPGAAPVSIGLPSSGDDHWRVRYVRTLHELFHVYVDDENILRVDHTVSFLGMTIIRLHYKMSPE